MRGIWSGIYEEIISSQKLNASSLLKPVSLFQIRISTKFGQALKRTGERMDKANRRGVRESPRKVARNLVCVNCWVYNYFCRGTEMRTFSETS